MYIKTTSEPTSEHHVIYDQDTTISRTCGEGAAVTYTWRRHQRRFLKRVAITWQQKEDTSSPFYLHGLTLIPAWISNYMPRKVCDEITYPFLNFNGATVEV